MTRKKTIIELGDRVRDRITGFAGIAIARTDWLNGCSRFGVQPEEMKDGKCVEVDWFDVDQIEIVDKRAFRGAKAESPTKPGGPRPDPSNNQIGG